MVLPKDVMLIRGGVFILKKLAAKSRGTGDGARLRSRPTAARYDPCMTFFPPL